MQPVAALNKVYLFGLVYGCVSGQTVSEAGWGWKRSVKYNEGISASDANETADALLFD